MKTIYVKGQAYHIKFDHNHFEAPTMTVCTVRLGSDGKGKIISESIVRKHVKDESDKKKAEQFAIEKSMKLFEESTKDYSLKDAFLKAYNA